MVLDHVKLEDMVGGNFEIRARLLSPSGETLSEKTAAITVSPRSTASRPRFVYRRGVNTRVPGLLSAMRGEQLWRLRKFEEAKAALEESLSGQSPTGAGTRPNSADIHLLEGEPDKALALLKPLEEPFPNQYDVVGGLGRAVHLKGDYARAVGYLERARELKPPEHRGSQRSRRQPPTARKLRRGPRSVPALARARCRPTRRPRTPGGARRRTRQELKARPPGVRAFTSVKNIRFDDAGGAGIV